MFLKDARNFCTKLEVRRIGAVLGQFREDDYFQASGKVNWSLKAG